MSSKRKYNADGEFTFTYATPGSTNRNPTATTSASPPVPPPSEAQSSTSPAKRPRLSSESGAGSSKPRRFAERFTPEKKAEEIMQYFADSHKYTLGDFLAYIFNPNSKLGTSASNSISYWLQGHTRVGTRPAEVVDLVYRHRDGIRRSGNQLHRASFSDLAPPTLPPSFTSARPQEVSLLPVVPEPSPEAPTPSLSSRQTNSREGLEELMVRGTLCIIDREAQTLADKNTGLPRSVGMTWDDVECLSRSNQESVIRQQAPVIWAILSTIVQTRATTTPQIGVQSTAAGPRVRDLIPAIMIIIFMLIALRNPLVNYFQAVMSVFMFSCNAHKLLFLVMNRMGLSTSHSTLQGNLQHLGESARAELRITARRALESACDMARQPQQYFLLVFDNVNKYHRARNQTIATKSHMKNGTAATAILAEDVVPGAFLPRPYWERILAQARQSMTVKQLLDDIDVDHLACVGAGMVMRTLIAYIPVLAGRLGPDLEERFKDSDGYAKHRLRLRRSVTMPMGTSAIDETSAAGVSDILHDLVSVQMGMEPSWFEKLLIMVGGDQLTIDRLRKIIRYRATEDNIYESRSWALPIIQIWHMKLAYLRSLINIHWFPKIGSDLFGFRQGTYALNRSIDPNKIDFYPCHDAVKVVFEGMVLTATYVLLQEEAGLSLEPTDRMLDELGAHFAPSGQYHNCSLGKLEEIAGRIYARYMTTDAYQQALALREAGESSLADLGTTILEELGKLDEQPDYVPNPTLSSGADQLLGNITLFMRDAFWYLELASAVPEGDVGRIFEVIKLLRFSFWGAAATNYGKELLELASNFLHEFSDSLRETVLNNYLVNPSGLAGRWQECDFFQEHSNKAIKSVFNSKNSEWDSGFLRNSVSVNITGLAHLRDTMLDFLGLRKPGSGQSQPDLSADINVLAKHYLEGQVFTFSPGRSQECVATDMFEAGLNKLEQGALKRFLERSAASRAGQLFEEPDPEDQGGDFVIPPEPLVMENGRLVPGEPNES